MSRKLFEYFFDPQELEPFYSELTGAKRSSTRIVSQPKKSRNRTSASLGPEAKPIKNLPPDKPASSDTTVASPAPEIPAVENVERNGERPTGVRDVRIGDRNQVPTSTPGARQPSEEIVGETAETATNQKQETTRIRVRNMLSVHALGQYVFCPRSAIRAAERGDERDIDEPPPRLTFLPNFELERIEEMLSTALKQLLLAAVLIVGLMVSMTLSSQDENPTQFNLAAITFFFALLWAAHLITSIVQLSIRRIAALLAEAREPEPSFEGTQPVNWWSMLKAGFEPIKYQRPFQHPELPLEGCPWRVLQKESLRIPVIHTGGDRLGNAKGKLFPKHEVRLTAYALLLEADGHLKVPYGLVFPIDSPHGIAFAITDNHRRQAVQLLAEFEQILNESQQRNVQPNLPENRNCCANCDYGKPVATSIREVASARKAGQQLVVLQSRKDELFHCDCGDRFGSAPPHRDSVRKGLRAILE
jgi:hypothetical protein